MIRYIYLQYMLVHDHKLIKIQTNAGKSFKQFTFPKEKSLFYN